MQEFDYVIIGSGSAGSVIAEKLTASGRHRVLLLEAGGTDLNPFIAAPVGETALLETKLDWGFISEEEQELGNNRLVMSRGRCLGGSSSINGQLCFRGHPGDYDEWAAMGNTGWSYNDVLPLFRNMETWEGGADSWRGDSGPLRTAKSRFIHPMFDAFLGAGKAMGYRLTPDFNGENPEGFGICQHTHYHLPVLRCSASYAYLLKARFRRNLKILKHAEAHRILLDGRKAVGVRYKRKGKMHDVMARHEVIVCAGAYQSSKLLMLSGIGPGEHLQEHGIPVVHDLKGVGGNLKEQIGSFVQHQSLQPITYYKYKQPWNATVAILQWILAGRGPLTVFPMSASAIVRSDESLPRADVQFYVFPLGVNPHVEGTYDTHQHAYNIHWGQCRPDSSGTVRLRSGNPEDPPLIHHNFYSDERDKVINRWAVRKAREIHAQAAFDPFRGPEIAPGPEVQTDDEIDEFTTRYFANHYHAASSNKMGVDDAAVVDPRCRVHGVEALRVADVSIMPFPVTGGLNVPTMMIGANAAKMILEDAEGRGAV